MESFGKTHRYFVQYMLKNGTTSIPKAMNYYSKVEEESVDEIKLGILLNQINRVISDQYFKIVRSKCEVTHEDLLIWLNLKNDPLTKLQVTFNEKELEYFQAILQEIANSEQRKLMIVMCINITSTLTCTFSRDNGQRVLDKWIKGGYFVKDDEYIYLGQRLILEFTSYLKALCPRCICNLCSELSFTGKICGQCDKIFHSYCIEKYLESQTSCPHCQQEWQESHIFNSTVHENRMNTTDSDTSDGDQESSQEYVNMEPGPSHRK